MSTEATGAAAPGTHLNLNLNVNVNLPDHDDSTIAVVNPQPADKSPKPTGLHSPPDSNNVDATDSELSDLDEAIADADSPSATTAPASVTAPRPGDNIHSHNHSSDDVSGPSAESGHDGPEQVPTPGQDEDIGEVLPDDWSGEVPIFKPTMHQFKDFKKFVCHFLLPPFRLSACPTFCRMSCQVATSFTNTRLHRWKLWIPTV